MAASIATQGMASQCCAAALFDGGHDLELREAQVSTLSLPIARPMGAEDVRDFQCGAHNLCAVQHLQRTDHFT